MKKYLTIALIFVGCNDIATSNADRIIKKQEDSSKEIRYVVVDCNFKIPKPWRIAQRKTGKYVVITGNYYGDGHFYLTANYPYSKGDIGANNSSPEDASEFQDSCEAKTMIMEYFRQNNVRQEKYGLK